MTVAPAASIAAAGSGAVFGVVGSVVDGAALDEMVRRLAHRGRTPWLGTRRSDGVMGTLGRDATAAPCEVDQFTVACDARIYDPEALRERLGDAGIANPPLEPAGLLLAVHRTLGFAGIEAVDGDFAFAIVDRGRGELLLGRDFFGCAPLYYTVLPAGGVAFASEYKALLAIPGVPADVDRDMVQYLQAAKRLPLGRTLLRHVRAVPPGGVLRLDLSGRRQTWSAFRPLDVRVTVRSEAEAVELIRSCLLDACRRRSADQDRIGIALSGGIDSIAMAFLFRRLYPDREIYTYTAGYGPDDREVVIARRVAERIASVHREVITPSTLLRNGWPRLVWHLEDPYSRSEALQLYEVGRAAAGEVAVLFSAQGADGLFGGMPKYKLLWLMKVLPPLRTGLAEFYNLTQFGTRARTMAGRLLAWIKYRNTVPPVPAILGATDQPEPIVFPPMSADFINRVLAGGFQRGVCQDIQKFERGFAAWGIGYRSPFYDMGLVRSAYTIADRLKIRRGIQKYIFRKAMASVVPREFCGIPKFPQRMRYDSHFADELDALADRVLDPTAVADRKLFAASSLSALRAARRGGRYRDEAAMRLWTAIATELWAETFVDGRGRPPDDTPSSPLAC